MGSIFRLCGPHSSLCCNYFTASLWYKSSPRQWVDRLCSNKTLFAKTGSWSDLVHKMQFADLSYKEHLTFQVSDRFSEWPMNSYLGAYSFLRPMSKLATDGVPFESACARCHWTQPIKLDSLYVIWPGQNTVLNLCSQGFFNPSSIENVPQARVMKTYEFIPLNIEIHVRWWVILAVHGLPFLDLKPNNRPRGGLIEREKGVKISHEQQQMETGRRRPKNTLS